MMDPIIQNSIMRCPGLTDQERNYLVYAQGDTVQTITDKALRDGFVVLIGNTFKAQGGKEPEGGWGDVIKVQSKEMVKEIRRYFPTITIDQLKHIFELGVRGRLGDFFGMSIVTYHKWIEVYMKSEEKKRAFKKLHDFHNVEYGTVRERKYTEEEKLGITHTGAMEFFKDYFRGGTVTIIAHIYVDYLNQIGLMLPTRKERAKYTALAAGKMEDEAIDNRRSKMITEKQLDDLVKTIFAKSNKNRSSLAKRLFLEDRLKDIKNKRLKDDFLKAIQTNYEQYKIKIQQPNR